MNFVDSVISALTPKPKLPNFTTGDTVSVHVKVKEGEKERIQIFKGTVIKIQGAGVGRSFTVRKMSDGVGVERTWPLSSPAIDKVELQSVGKVRRSRVYYLRGLKGRAAKLESEYLTKSTEAKKAPETETKQPN